MEDDDGAVCIDACLSQRTYSSLFCLQWDEDFVDDGIDLMNRPSMTNLITAGSFAHLHVTSNISQHSAATVSDN